MVPTTIGNKQQTNDGAASAERGASRGSHAAVDVRAAAAWPTNGRRAWFEAPLPGFRIVPGPQLPCIEIDKYRYHWTQGTCTVTFRQVGGAQIVPLLLPQVQSERGHPQPERHVSREFARLWAHANSKVPAAALDSESCDTTLVVLVGLPGLGKSHLVKRLREVLAEPGNEELEGRVCVSQKDEHTLAFSKMHPGARPSTADILNMTIRDLKIVRAKSKQSKVTLLFNMSMNPRWLKEIVKRVRRSGCALNKVVVLTPPPEPTFRQLQAAAIALASDRPLDAPPDVASTLPPEMAWEVLTNEYFGTPGRALSSVKTLSDGLGDSTVPFKEVTYPVPQLGNGVVIGDECPASLPRSWTKENIVFPDPGETRAALLTLIEEL